ncbi:uncharacterized protein LOC143584041 [Bidens hawaiensis]|uniref:uncharacterized protein LOC143584041 n=1 Tax=Bidens hawaiensis TaxID=980011 RepID=UPI004049282D
MFNRLSQFRSILYRRCWKEMMLERAEQEERERFQKILELEARIDKLIERERLRKIEEFEARLEEISARIQNESFSYKEQEAFYKTDDDFWNNDDEGVIEEMELELPGYTDLREHVVDEPLDQMEDDEEKKHVPSWEDEFGDELVGLRVFDEHAEFDPVGDLIYLETLIMGKPTMEIKMSPEEEKEEEVAKEDDQNMVVVDSSHHMKVGKSVEELDGGPPPKSAKPQKRKRKCVDQHVMRVQKWYIKSCRRTMKCKNYHFPHYMPRIRFGPGKFKYWWSDPFECFKMLLIFTMCYFFKYVERVELNGLDRGWIKEKPPD